MSQSFDIEARLRQALAPIDPPAELAERMELRLGSLVEMAADELEAWELSAMRDPRNWPRAAVRPAAAVVVGAGAGAGLVFLRTRRRRHKRRAQSHGALAAVADFCVNGPRITRSGDHRPDIEISVAALEKHSRSMKCAACCPCESRSRSTLNLATTGRNPFHGPHDAFLP